MKAAHFFLASSYSAAACLYAVGLVGTDAEAAVPAAHLSRGSEAEANSSASVRDDGWSTAAPTEESELTKSPFSDYALHDVPDLDDGSAPSASGETLLVLPGAYAVETGLQTGLAIPSLSPQSERDRRARPRLFASLWCACALLAVSLGVMALRTKEVPPDSQPAGSLHVGGQHQHHGSETVTAGQPLQSVDELKKIQPLAARLAEMVGTDESRSALSDFRSGLRRSQDIDETAVGRVTGPSGSPSTAVKTAIEDSVSALSRLYEAAREHGQTLAEAARKAVPPEFSDEMEAVKSALGTRIRELVDLREQSIQFSSHVYIAKVEKAAAELKGLRRLETTEDLHLLAAAAKSLEVLSVTHFAIKIESVSFHEIRSNLATALSWHCQVRNRSIHRELEGELAELRTLCTLERQRRQRLSIQDASALETLELVEEQLKRCEQQLDKHKMLMKRVKNARDIVSALEAEEQAIAVADSLKALLEAVARSRRSIPGVASEEEAAQSEAMQHYRKQLANKRRLEAEKDWKSAADMLKAAETEVSGDFASPSEQEDTASKLKPFARNMSTQLARIVADNLKEVEDAKAALRKPVKAEEDKGGGSSSAAARTEELLGVSQAAAKAAMHSLKLAGFIWLRARLNKSLEIDMWLSTTMVREATATLRRAIGEEAQQQHEHIEMSAADTQEFEELLAEFNSGQEKAQSANGLNELASAVAGMKQAALKLMAFLEERQKLLTKR